jgi:hypothetical protein
MIGSGSTMSVSLEDPEVLTTLPATVTGSDDVVLSAGVLLREQAVSTVSTVSTVSEEATAASVRGAGGWAAVLRRMHQVRTDRFSERHARWR